MTEADDASRDEPTTPGPVRTPTYLTVAEVATMMRLSRMSVYRLIHAGDLAAVRFGRSFRVPAEEVRRYLDAAHYQAG
jgi:excisionase family DNA binding protein